MRQYCGRRGQGETATAGDRARQLSKAAVKVVDPREGEETFARTMPISVPFSWFHYHFCLQFPRLLDTPQPRLRHYALLRSVITG